MLLNKTNSLLLASVFFFAGCVASPKPQLTDLTKLPKEEKVVKAKDKAYKPQVIEKDFEIIHNGLNSNEVTQELIDLHKKDDEDYVIGAGDMFNVFVYEEPDLNVKGSVVKADGTLTFQLIGDVKVAGLTINQAMEKIARKLKRYLVNPIVSIIPVEFRSKSFTILGKVSQPGTYQIVNDARVIDSIALAEGLSIGIFEDNTIELADLEHAFIRRGKKVLPVNFIELVRKGNPLHNVPLQDKDYINLIKNSNNQKISAYSILNSNDYNLFKKIKERDSLLGVYFYVSQRTFYPVSGSYESAIADNKINSFKNKEITQNIIKLYSSTYSRLADNVSILDERWNELSKKYSGERRKKSFKINDNDDFSIILDDIYYHYLQLNWYNNVLESTVSEIDDLLLKLND